MSIQKKISLSFFSSLLLLIISSPSFAIGYTALSSCKAVVGSIDTAGSGGITNGSGSLVATGPGLNIVVCDIYEKDQPSITIAVKEFPPFNDIVCNLTSYFNGGSPFQSSSDSSQNTSFGGLTENLSLSVASQSFVYYGLSCRLGQGDQITNYRHN